MKSAAQRFFEKVQIVAGGCWQWTAATALAKARMRDHYHEKKVN